MKNIKRQLVNYRNAMVMHMWNVKNKLQDTSGEGYVDTAIKILIAVVLGALLLAGLYALFNDTVLPTLVRRVQEMFDYSGCYGNQDIAASGSTGSAFFLAAYCGFCLGSSVPDYSGPIPGRDCPAFLSELCTQTAVWSFRGSAIPHSCIILQEGRWNWRR